VNEEYTGSFRALPSNLDIPDGSVGVSYRSEDSSTSWGYRIYFDPIFDQKLVFNGVQTAFKMLEKEPKEKLKLIVSAITSDDLETQMMASRTLANMMFVCSHPSINTNLQEMMFQTCLGPFQSLADRSLNETSARYEIFNSSRIKNPVSVRASNLLLHPLKLNFGKKVAYEVTLKTMVKFMWGGSLQAVCSPPVKVFSVPVKARTV